MDTEKHYSYDVAISYAGEDRNYAHDLAEALKAQGISVFYDHYEKATLWGKNLYDYLSDLYQNQARYCIMLLSADYARKVWTTHEREAAQIRAVQEHKEYILPIRLDTTDLPGHLKTVAYLDWHEETPESITQAIVEKLGRATLQKGVPHSQNLSPPPQPNYTDTAEDLNNLADLYKAQGRYAEAEPLYRRALAIWEQALGPNHPSIATCLNDLADLYKAQGMYAEAEPLYQRALAIREQALEN